MKYNTNSFNGNNRKRTRGRTIGVTEVTKETIVLKDMGFKKHTAKKHLISTCPQTGEKLYTKQGKAGKGKFITTLTKGSKLKVISGRKFWIEQETTNRSGGLF